MVVEGNFGKYGTKIAIGWQYDPRKLEHSGKVVRDTYCTIKSLTNEGVTMTVAAYQSPGDNFVKEKGRKISLGRTMKLIGFDKEQREFIWHSYFNRKERLANAA